MNTQSRTAVTPQTFLKTAPIIHVALIAGQVLFAVLIIAQNGNDGELNFRIDNNEVFTYLVPLFGLGGLVGGQILFKSKMNEAKQKSTLNEKLGLYQTGMIIRFALCEGPSLFGIAVTSITHNLAYLLMSAVMILYMLILRPTRDKVETDLNLSFEDNILLTSKD